MMKYIFLNIDSIHEYFRYAKNKKNCCLKEKFLGYIFSYIYSPTNPKKIIV